MVSAGLFLVVALRALIELVFWVMIGRITLVLLAGRVATVNSVVQMFDIVLRPPRTVMEWLLPEASPRVRDLALGILLALLWLGLAYVKWLLLN